MKEDHLSKSLPPMLIKPKVIFTFSFFGLVCPLSSPQKSAYRKSNKIWCTNIITTVTIFNVFSHSGLKIQSRSKLINLSSA